MRRSRLLIGLLLLLALAPTARAAMEIHLGIPTSDPSRAVSVHWREDTARPDAAVTLQGPQGTVSVPATRVPGPSPGAAYEARLTGLSPATPYTYTVGGRSFNFTTAPASLGKDGSFTFVALADMGDSAGTGPTMTKLAELDPDFILHPGDLSYARGRNSVWANWFRIIEPQAATRPWLIALGNHEADPRLVSDADREVAFFRQRFGLPGNELWYSFDWGGVHFVALDTYSREANGNVSTQVAWLEADLKAHAKAPWTIVYLHEPPYSSGRYGPSERVQQRLVPLFEKHGVDLVITGHEHSYERSYPLLGGRPVDRNATTYPEGKGIVYLVTGGAGRQLYDDWTYPAPNWSAARKSLHHVVAITVTPTTLSARVVPTTGSTFRDTFTLVRAAPVEDPDPGPGNTNTTPKPGDQDPPGKLEAMPGFTAALGTGAAALVALLRRGRR